MALCKLELGKFYILNHAGWVTHGPFSYKEDALVLSKKAGFTPAAILTVAGMTETTTEWKWK